MNSTSFDEDLVEEREELMVFPSENSSQPIAKETHFLNPSVPTINEPEANLHPPSSPNLKASPLYPSFSRWKQPNKKFKLWAKKMAALHKPTWIKSGIFEAIKASTYKIHKDPSLILSLASKWCQETRSFVFPWGEATLTLEDVTLLLGFSLLGSSVAESSEMEEEEEAVEKLEKQRKVSVSQVSWISSFADDEMEHEAFLVYWLSNFVFPCKPNCWISKDVFGIAIRLARGERIALAPAVLASLYRDLGRISNRNVALGSLFKLVQVWTWERFKNIRPEAKMIQETEPRIAQWSDLKPRFSNETEFKLEEFEWRPYTKPLRNWELPPFYIEESEWARIDDDDAFATFARCVRVSKLVGIGFVEEYYPNRVAMQFGSDQDLPGLVTHNRNLTEKEAWEDYNRPHGGLEIYIPSRLATGSVTARYRDWWVKSVSETRKEPVETFDASDTVDHYDEDVSLKVVPLREVFQKLGDGMKKGEQVRKKRRKRDREDDNMDCCQAQDEDDSSDPYVASSGVAEKEGDGITTCGNVENTEGGEDHGGFEGDLNVSERREKLPCGAETQETEKMSGDKNDVLIDYETLKQRKLGVEELILKLEDGFLKMRSDLAKLKQWRMRKNLTKKTPVSA